MKPMMTTFRFLVVAAALWVSCAVAAETPSAPITIAVLPFQVNAESDLAYLQRGVADMFASRLDAEPGITVKKLPADRPEQRTGVGDLVQARTIGNELAVNQVLFGSLTVFGESVSMDVRLVNVEGPPAPRSFFKQAESLGKVIPAVNESAREISASLAAPVGAAVAAAPAPAATPATPAPVPVAASQAGDGFWKSRNYPLEILGLSAGNLDQDGHAAVVFVTRDAVHAYRVVDQRLAKVGRFDAQAHQRFIAVDMGDINGNGRDEVFVTCRDFNSGRLESIVLEKGDHGLAVVADKQPWYFRVLTAPGMSPVLAGQKRALQEPFLNGIYRLSWDGGAYTDAERLPLPGSAQVFGIVRMDLLNDGQLWGAAFDSGDRIGVYNAAGEREWKSDDRFGGSEAFIDYVTDPSKSNATKNRVYVNQRIMAIDANADGKTTLLVVTNDSLTGHYFDRIRKYRKAKFQLLAWDGLGVAPVAESKEISSYISDFYIYDVDNDQQPELIAAAVMESDSLISKGKSAVIVYDLSVLKP